MVGASRDCQTEDIKIGPHTKLVKQAFMDYLENKNSWPENGQFEDVFSIEYERLLASHVSLLLGLKQPTAKFEQSSKPFQHSIMLTD